MANALEVTPRRGRAPGDDYYRRMGLTREEQEAVEGDRAPAHPFDGPDARATLRKLLEWFYYERDKQAHNRLEMAMDADFYDSIQWDPEDAQALRDRGQMPLVYNEVAPMCDWLIGTEIRTRVDWSVLPRTEDDVQLADVKTKTLKYVSDVNRVPSNRSRSFSDAIKAGLGWIDDGVRDDPTQDRIYNRYEDWRNVLYDSLSYELDLSDARYVFRWRWVDEDIALAMYPDRADAIRAAVENHQTQTMSDWEEDTWYTSEELLSGSKTGTLRASGQGMMIDAKRRRVKIYEAQYRMPADSKIVADGPLQGVFFDPRDKALSMHLAVNNYQVIDKVVMRVHMALFTESHMLRMGVSPYRHNRFTLTPVWCYRRGRDRLPYGVIRRVRDIQQDLNKRASKALFQINTQQIIAEDGATDDWDELREEAGRPDGLIIGKSGKKLEIRPGVDVAAAQVQMMTLQGQAIQKSGGVAQENMGRPTNAVSGRAIEARQMQGSVVTTEPFENLRLATQVSGEKQLSNAEQFYTEQKIMRLTGAKGAIEWVKINQPEVQPDGSVRWLNDITASKADFIVSEADYAGTLRQVMFENLQQIAQRLPPEIALRLLIIAYEFSDLPNKDEIAGEIRRMTGERDPNKPMTPEETAQAEQQMRAQAEALEVQRQMALASLEETQGKARKLMAEANKIEAEAQAVAAGEGGDITPAVQQAVAQLRQEADQVIEKLSADLQKARSDLANRTLQIRADSDSKLEAARIDADAKIRIAEIQADANKVLERFAKTVDDLRSGVEARLAKAEQQARDREIDLREEVVEAREGERDAKKKAKAKTEGKAE
ncbi:Putative uncharacterized protein precursor [Hydrogenophaga intermedia]|uniref:Portal protein n=1 Tax=Hydrogenophaga intermedia TaxID=65786 RepID=A0A1L1PPQ4_HYDIT|nr:hypothetical protein [Hydrogenophaga intermedia]CDN87335.1 Putative uncharacterized protein precursor [Hydrogenophaga intermedia]